VKTCSKQIREDKGKIRGRDGTTPNEIVILPPQNVSLSKAVLMRKGGEDDEVKAGTLHA
jgi:hypothetical protein